MDFALFTSLAGFAFLMSITPGPNNLMLMSSSALFGVRATLPHWIGINIGFNILVVASVFGLGGLVERFPWTLWLVKIGGAAWLIWMAWLFLRAGLAPAEGAGSTDTPARSRPFRIHEAALFQWINPKALMMTISAAGAYIALAEAPAERAALMVLAFLLFGAPCGLAWTLAGGAIHRFMNDPAWSRRLNFVIAGLLVVTIGLVVTG